MQQILSKPPAEVQYENDFVRRHYNRKQSFQSFTDHAQLFDWISWLHSQGLIRPLLLDFRAPYSEEDDDDYHALKTVHDRLAIWLGRTLARDASGMGFSIVEECGGTLNSDAARGIFLELLNTFEKTPLTETAIPTIAQRRWLLLFLRQSPATYGGLHAQMIDILVKRKHWPTALRVVAYLVSTMIRKPRGDESDGIVAPTPGPALTGEQYDLPQALETIKAHAGTQPQRQAELLAVLESACLELGELYVLLGRNNHHHSELVPFESILTISEIRSDSIRVMVRFTCLIALDLAIAGGLKKAYFIRWLDSKNQILIRCALLCMAKSTLPAGEILDVLLNHDGIYPLAFRADIERAELINRIYPKLTEAEKDAYWRAVRAGPSAEWEEGAPDEQI
jgi:hypothetical protein